MTYIVGSHWFICDVCGQKYRSTEKKKRWDGLIVCPADNEADHPQKYIRVESDGQAVPDPRPRPEDVFALPVYCTPVTRTAAADDGTADCMTVDYRLNINYRDYGAYQPIVAPTSTPTPILLDTFTAANGTDPTTRDMDVYPAGAARWAASNYVEAIVGVINGNAWTYTPGAGTGPGYENMIALQVEASSPLVAAYPYAVFVHVTMPAAPFNAMYVSMQSNVNSTPISGNFVDFLIGANSGFGVDVYVRLGASYLSEYPAFDVSGEHKYVFWVDGATWALVADGVIVSQGAATVPLFSNLDGFTVATQGENNTTADRALHAVGIYQGLTLAEATALTA